MPYQYLPTYGLNRTLPMGWAGLYCTFTGCGRYGDGWRVSREMRKSLVSLAVVDEMSSKESPFLPPLFICCCWDSPAGALQTGIANGPLHGAWACLGVLGCAWVSLGGVGTGSYGTRDRPK